VAAGLQLRFEVDGEAKTIPAIGGFDELRASRRQHVGDRTWMKPIEVVSLQRHRAEGPRVLGSRPTTRIRNPARSRPRTKAGDRSSRRQRLVFPSAEFPSGSRRERSSTGGMGTGAGGSCPDARYRHVAVATNRRHRTNLAVLGVGDDNGLSCRVGGEPSAHVIDLLGAADAIPFLDKDALHLQVEQRLGRVHLHRQRPCRAWVAFSVRAEDVGRPGELFLRFQHFPILGRRPILGQ